MDGAKQRKKKNYWFRPCYALLQVYYYHKYTALLQVYYYYKYTTCVDEASLMFAIHQDSKREII